MENIKSGSIPKKYKIMPVVINEELKTKKARGFCKTTPQIRLRQTATENNLADEDLKLIPTQTMTLSDVEPVKKVCDINDHNGCGNDYVFMSMDC